ncbi:hypothetical protein JVU11DRAFT_4010 [Chiua virens]|nr:hypothetical protein JVU11DRAFT_4010 [Chiua virens]
MTVDVVSPRDVQTTLNYYQATKDDQLPYYYVCEPPAGVPQNNVTTETHPVVVHDARGKQDAFKLDVSGFEWVTSPSAEKEFVDEARIKEVYYPEVEALLKAHVGAKRVFIFDHTIRRSADPFTAPGTRPATAASRGPAHLVHADQTSEAAEYRVQSHLPEDAERLLKGRYQIINVWRPIANPVAHDPLGLADFRSIDVHTDLFVTRLVRAPHDGQVYSVKYNPGHKWYYLADQTPDKVTLIKCFDSDTDNAVLTPHSAFSDKTSPAGAPRRQSIEVRALVFDRE